MGQWIVGVISFQKIFGLCGLRGHKVEIRWDVTIVDNGRTECEDRAILKQNSQFIEFGTGRHPLIGRRDLRNDDDDDGDGDE